MSYFLSPIGNSQQSDANGDPGVGFQIYTYLAGSTTPAATYTDDTGGTQQANPIVLSALGLPTNPIWLAQGVAYKMVCKDASNVTLWTIDDISGVNDAATSASEWVDSRLVPTYVSATSFTVPGDQTDALQIGRRLKTANTAGLIYSTITNSVFGALTTVTVANDSGTLDAGLSNVAYGLLSKTHHSIPSFGFTLAASGYQKFPSGLILQWGSAVTSGAGVATFTFPIAFPSAHLSTQVAYVAGVLIGDRAALNVSGGTTTSVLCYMATQAGAAVVGGTVNFLSIGA